MMEDNHYHLGLPGIIVSRSILKLDIIRFIPSVEPQGIRIKKSRPVKREPGKASIPAKMAAAVAAPSVAFPIAKKI